MLSFPTFAVVFVWGKIRISVKGPRVSRTVSRRMEGPPGHAASKAAAASPEEPKVSSQWCHG